MQGPFLREYGESAVVPFQLFTTDGKDFKTNAVYAAGDTKIMKDEGDEANTANGFADEGTGYSITLSAAEMEAARIVVYIVDQTSPKLWLDTAVVIETFGHANAQHASPPTAAEVADVVWDEARVDHTSSGSMGEAQYHAHADVANRKQANKADGTTKVFEDDGSTVLIERKIEEGANDDLVELVPQ